MIKSVSDDQTEIIASIMKLCSIDRFDIDLTYGNGEFWKSLPHPLMKIDIDPQQDDVIRASSTSVPLPDEFVNSVMFDPPFMTYVRAGREGNGQMVMARRFGGYWKYSELAEHYQHTAKEAHRLLRKGGIFVVKCQDIVHNHKLHSTHMFMNQWCEGMFRLRDLFVLTAKNRMPIPQQKDTALKIQRHARIHHSYFMVFEKC